MGVVLVYKCSCDISFLEQDMVKSKLLGGVLCYDNRSPPWNA